LNEKNKRILSYSTINKRNLQVVEVVVVDVEAINKEQHNKEDIKHKLLVDVVDVVEVAD
jgi:hypothetical protein